MDNGETPDMAARQERDRLRAEVESLRRAPGNRWWEPPGYRTPEDARMIERRAGGRGAGLSTESAEAADGEEEGRGPAQQAI